MCQLSLRKFYRTNGRGWYWNYSLPGFPAVYMLRRGVENANLLEEAVSNHLVKPHLVRKIRILHYLGRPLKVALLGGGPCLEAIVILRLVDKLQLTPKLKVKFINYKEVSAWQAGHSVLGVQVRTYTSDLTSNASRLSFWEEMSEQHIGIAW
ncbi:hypothetical protein ABBQ38_001190 [Trebouxia sp. C0009 RCD-2024]